MTKLYALVLAAFLASLALNCTHTTNVVKDCSAQTAIGLVDDINTAVATDRYREELKRLAVEWGMCAVKEAAKIVLSKIGVRAQYDAMAAVQRDRLEMWLAENP